MERILQVLPRFRRGGSQMMVMNLYRSIDRSKIQFDFVIFTKDRGVFYDEILSLGGRVFVLPRFNGKNYFQYKKAWNVFFDKHPEYKIIHSHYRSCASIYFKIAKKHGLKTIIHSHSTSNGHGLLAIIKNLLQRPLRKQADYLFACSDLAGEWLFGKRATKLPNYKMIPNGIDIAKFVFNKDKRDNVRQEYFIEKDCFVIGHVGRFSKMKNHKFLVDLFYLYHKKNPNSKLLLVGGGECENELKIQIQKMGLERDVILAGIQENTDYYYSAMDVFVFPSIWEGLPVSVVEAQASGLQCLVSDSITTNVKLTNNIHYLSLKNINDWFNKLLTIQINNRSLNRLDYDNLQLFDSKKVAEDLTSFYLSLL